MIRAVNELIASLEDLGPAGRSARAPTLARSPLLAPPETALEPVAPAELSALVHAGENESDACERILAQVARAEGALDLALGDGLAALTVGDRLISLGYSALRAARDSGVSYERLRVLARLPARELEAWIPRARGLTCVALRAAVEAHEDTQLRAARVLRARVPERVAELLRAAFRAVRAAEGKLLDDGRCLVLVARHFADTWRAHVKGRRTRSQKIRARDLDRCQVPGCSRRAMHAHHIISRARGGSDDAWNEVGLCPCHHLRGIHGGYLRVSGRAPDGLVWELVGAGGSATPFRAGAVP